MPCQKAEIVTNACITGGLMAIRFGDVPVDLWKLVPVPEESREVLDWIA